MVDVIEEWVQEAVRELKERRKSKNIKSLAGETGKKRESCGHLNFACGSFSVGFLTDLI